MTVQPETIRQDVYSAIRTLLVANKPSYTYDNATIEYTLVAEYGRQSSSFPYIVLNKALIGVELLNIDGSGEEYEVSIQLDIYALELHRKVAVDVALDSIQNTFLTNQSSLKSTDGILLMQDPFDESNTTPFDDNGQVLNTASIIIKMNLA